MKRFVLTEQADADIDEVWEYIAENNINTADKIRDELYAAMQKLADMPRMGHARLDLADERHRFWVTSPCMIVYRLDTEPLQVIRVLHGARNIEALFER